ncbi:MAG: hypothetical protein ACRDOK_21070 [Streptosporangiaceae bacterium]
MTERQTTVPVWPVRRAAVQGTCGRPDCTTPIHAGSEITKPPGRPWQHVTCPGTGEAAWPRSRREEEL